MDIDQPFMPQSRSQLSRARCTERSSFRFWSQSKSMKPASRQLAVGLSLVCLLLVMAGRAPAAQTIQGVRDTPIAHAVVNFQGIAAMEQDFQLANTNRHKAVPNHAPFRTNLPPAGGDFQAASAGGGSFQLASVPPTGPSPPPVVSFPALEDNNTSIPPDTHGAAGPNHLMVTLNTQVRIQTRAGATLSTVSLASFWQAVGVIDVFDPKVLYDSYAGRWIFTAAAESFTARSSILMAVSQTSDPTGNWYLYRVDADRNNLDWIDYPSLGFNKDWIVVTGNMFPIGFTAGIGFSGVNIWVFNKTNLYTNGVGQFTVLRDASTIGFTMVPAITMDPNLSTMHLIEVDNLINNFNATSSRLRLSTITGPVGSEVLTLGTAFSTDTNVWASTELFFFTGGFAPQLNSQWRVDNNDSRIQNVVYRNGSLWCAHTVFLPANLPSRSAVQWWELGTNGTSIQFGRIDDPTGVNYYAFPSIAVNRNDDALIGFSRFSTNQYPSANYAFRSCSDPPNTFRTDFLMKDGEGEYYKTFVPTNFFFFGENRWGDYSSTVVDPVNDLDMWTIQEYAAAPNLLDPIGFQGRWGTWWGKVAPVETCFNIEFTAVSYNALESVRTATITVLNIGGAPGTVYWSATEGTAKKDIDFFERRDVPLTFAAGQLEGSFTVEMLDNANVESNRTVNLALYNPSGPASLGRVTNAVLTIEDDETTLQPSQAGEFVFSSYLNGGVFYSGSEYEGSFVAPAGNGQAYTILGARRDAPGVLVTVVRTNGNLGRVLVDYETVDGGTAIPFADYTPITGTLVFDDYQMSTNFLVEVFPNSIIDFLGTGTRFIRVRLSNPRPAPEEEFERPGTIRPKLGLGAESGILLHDIFPSPPIPIRTNAFTFERRNWRVDEYSSVNAVGGYRFYNIEIYNPPDFSANPIRPVSGSVSLETRQSQTGVYILSPTFLSAGSDYAEAPDPPGGQQPVMAEFDIWPNPTITDPALAPISNFSDYLQTNMTVQFGDNQGRRNITIVVTNDPTVEFNEDIMFVLGGIPGATTRPVNPYGRIATLTILNDDQPAGAVDREWNPFNVTQGSFNQTPGANFNVRAVAIQPDGKCVLAGDFTAVNGDPIPRIARMTTNGVLDLTFEPGNGLNAFASSLLLYPPTSVHFGKILVAGGFTSYDNRNLRRGIARVLPGGALDLSFDPGNGANGPIWSMAMQSDGKIIVGGSFTEFNDIPRAGVARLNEDGSVDLTFDPGGGPDGGVYAVGLAPNLAGGQSVVIGGDFITFDGEFQGGVARLNPDGTLDPTFQTGAGTDGFVNSLVVQSDGRVIIAGFFSNYDAKKRINLARLNPDGSLDASFDPGQGTDGQIFSIVLQPDGKALIGGPFTSFNGTRRMGFARLRLNGTLDTSFLDTAYNQFAGLPRTFSFEPPSYVAAFAVQPDGNIMIGGSFTRVGGHPSGTAALRNSWTVFTRADKQPRYNIARILGGATPGPGNAEFNTDQYYVDENGTTASVLLERIDGRLGSLTAQATTADRVATNGLDFISTNLVSTWREGYRTFPVVDWAPISVGQVRDVYLRIPILDDTLQEGDETLDMSFLRGGGGVNLGGELIPLGGALGLAHARLTITDNDRNAGVFNFSAPSYVTNENAINALITVVRSGGSDGPASVDYFTRRSTNTPVADLNVDYREARGFLSFGSGETVKTFQVPIINDNQVELDENIELVLTNASGARLPGGKITSVAIATLTIIDNDYPPGRLNFALSSFTTNENSGFATIAVTRAGGNLGAVSVQYDTANGTAIAPADYQATAGTIGFNDGESGTKTFVIPLVADGIVDNDLTRFESVSLRLFNPRVGTIATPALLGARPTATLLIEDSDNYGTLAFNQAFYEADENGGAATVVVVRSGGVAGTVSIDLTVTPANTNSIGTDYVATNGTLTFQPGEISKSFTITLLDDSEGDGAKDLTLSLTNAVLAGVGTPNSVTLRLIDNESFSFPAGEIDTSFDARASINGPVFALGLQQDGKVLAAGDFTEMNEVLRIGVGRLNSDGTLDAAFDPGAGPNGTVRAMTLQRDGKALLGGAFTQFNGTNRNGVVRLGLDGSVDSSFNPGAGANSAVFGLLLQPDEKLLVCGSFSTFNGTNVPGIVRLNTNGLVDATFRPGSGANAAVFALAQQNDGRILVAGDFTQFAGQNRSRLVRLNPDGSLDLSFDPSLTFNAAVRAVLVQHDGRIVVGGSFTNINGIQRNYVARLNSDGTLDTTFLDTGLTGMDNVVLALAQQVDGKILAAGDFRRFNGVTRNRLTRINEDGAADPTINFGNGADSFIAALAVQPDRKIVIGGGFSTYDDQPRERIARIHGGAISGGGAIEFSRPEFLVQENFTNAVISVRRRLGSTGVASVNYQSLDGTALAGTHYQAVAGTVTFPEGETRQQFLVPLLDNSAAAGDLTFNLELIDGTYSPGVTNGPQPYCRVVILDNEGVISFSTATYNQGENVPSGLATIVVERRGGTSGSASVSFATGGGTATPFQDYFPTNGTLIFQPGQTNRSFHVRLVDDAVSEPAETIGLSLSNPTGSNSLGIASATLLLLDNDFAPGQFVLSSPVYSVTETSSVVFVTVLRTNGSSGFASVRYGTADGTALNGFDYSGTNNVILTFADGVTAQTVSIPILEDLLVESPESFTVSLSSPFGATIGSVGSATVTIIDNDVSLIVAAGSTLVSETNPNNALDPGELVSIAFALRNLGTGNTTNLIATLLPGNGVLNPSGSQSYGGLVAGGAAISRTFGFTASGANGDQVLATLLLTENGVTNGFVTFPFTIGGQASRTFNNTNRITINNELAATPYPSVINVANLGGTITKVTVTLTNFTHTFPDDVDVLLISPSGERVMLMSDAGDRFPVSNLALGFSSTATNPLPDTTQLFSRVYVPNNYAAPGQNTSDTFPLPAPQVVPITDPFPYTNTSLAIFNGINPNGPWSLFVVDDTAGEIGSIGGWYLSIQTSDPVSSAANLVLAAAGPTSTVAFGASVNSVITVTNAGNTEAGGVVVMNEIPVGMNFVGASASSGSWKKVGHTFTWNLGTLAKRSSATLSLTGQPTSIGTLVNTYTVGGNQADLNTSDNTATVVTTVVPGPVGLSIVRVNNTLELSWPANTGLILQSADRLSPANWANVGGAPQVMNNQNLVTVSVGGTNKYFRLRSP